jgi:fucose permease
MLLTSMIDTSTTYWSGIVPGMVVLGFFSGVCFPTIGNAALHEVTGQDSSLASGVQSAVQQIGGALGLSVLVTIGLRHAAGQMRHGVTQAAATTHGFTLAYHIAVVMLLVGGVLVLALFERVASTPRTPELDFGPEDALESVGASA